MAIAEALTRRSTKALTILDLPDLSSGSRSSHSVSEITLDRFSDPGMPRTASAADLAGEGAGEVAKTVPVSAARRCSSPVTEYRSYRLKCSEPRDSHEWSRVSAQLSPRLAPLKHSDDRWQAGHDMKLESLAPPAWTLKALKAPATLRCRDVQCCARESGPHPCRKIQRASADCPASLAKPKAHTLPRTGSDGGSLIAAPSAGGANLRMQNSGGGGDASAGPKMTAGGMTVGPSTQARHDRMQSHGLQDAAAPSNAPRGSNGDEPPVEDRNGSGDQGRQGDRSGRADSREEEEDIEDMPLLSSQQQVRTAKSILVKSMMGLRGEERRERRNKRVRWRDGHGELLVLVREFSTSDRMDEDSLSEDGGWCSNCCNVS